MSDCIFCKIAAGEIPSTTLYEDDKVKVIFDAGPATVGHALVIPKSHAANVFEIDDELLVHAHIVAKKIATALKEATGCQGVNILQNNGVQDSQCSMFIFTLFQDMTKMMPTSNGHLAHRIQKTIRNSRKS
ncbi:MAG: HIT family protein [Eubacterium sp.]|uniref:HIT family protein n=1 Tax=Eubacterium sp. TaxID=142586 RepID=UPI003995EEBE